ncbi:NUDIX hydrolase [Erysipelothrix sp. HDW6C]|uniref:NUDIX hydrolase n=1 Tax=Erysipelothrix sp. HDW6C TaxID=2714930 RepID=UPI00140A5DF7|nr:NUDIX domain-containing protein [Erysipelothrix sp. HDW6C]QIK70098.1 NUDIX hydrolase [Erysipelothrix sp. HDW6C]
MMEFKDYVKPAVATDVVCFSVRSDYAQQINHKKLPPRKLAVLLVKRGVEPFLGEWCLPGGFMRPGETSYQTARRELCEETGYESDSLYLSNVYSEPNRDSRGWVISHCYFTTANESQALEVMTNQDAVAVGWFDVVIQSNINEDIITLSHSVMPEITYQARLRENHIIEGNIPFDHALMIRDAYRNLREHLDASYLAFNLVNDRFTLNELQSVYEVIYGHPIDNFRRRIKDLVESTGLFTTTGAHRNSELFIRKK